MSNKYVELRNQVGLFMLSRGVKMGVVVDPADVQSLITDFAIKVIEQVEVTANLEETCANCGRPYAQHLHWDGNKCSLGSITGWFPKTIANALTNNSERSST